MLQSDFKPGTRCIAYIHGNRVVGRLREEVPELPPAIGDRLEYRLFFRDGRDTEQHPLWIVSRQQCRLLKPKKKAPGITREMLAAAWDKYRSLPGAWMASSHKSEFFAGICEELGL